MSAWIILLLLLAGNNCGCGNTNGNASCGGESGGCDERFGRNRGGDGDCDCDFDTPRFEPRFDARPFSDRETCSCEENDN
ncbi:MAG: hypothetical protein NC321_07160 [Clostridium sp.]|nr:hypothetical protein [Clostridium sp.]